MKTNKLIITVALSVIAITGNALAQNTAGGNGTSPSQGDQIKQRDQDRIQDCTTADLEKTQSRLRQQMPADVSTAVQEMKQAREQYTDQKRELKRTLTGTTEMDRQQLRDQLRQVAKDQTRDREQLRDRLQELQASVPTHQDLMTQARERKSDRARRGE
jgi:hypothetical protein